MQLTEILYPPLWNVDQAIQVDEIE